MDKIEQSLISEIKSQSRMGIAASIPAFLLCAVTLMMLILDTAIPSMSDAQYVVYPAAVRIVSLISIVCFAFRFSWDLSYDSIHIGIEDVFFLMFVLCMLISTSVNGISRMAVFGVAYRYVGVYDLLIFIFVYRYCAGRIDSGSLQNAILYVYIAIADAIALAFIIDHFTGSIAAFRNKAEPSAIFFHGNHYGYFLVMAIIIAAGVFLYEKDNFAIFGALSFIMNMGALSFNRSMGSIVAAGAVLLLMIIVSVCKDGSERKKAVLFLCFAIAAAIASVLLIRSLRADIIQMFDELKQIISGDNNLQAGNGRWGIWQYVAGYIADYPIWGYGCEGISEIMRDYTLTGSPHNEPLTYAAFFGIPAAVLYCFGVLSSIIKGLISGKNTTQGIAAYAALGYFVSSIFGVAMFYTTPFLFLLLGLAAGATKDRNP